MRRQGAMRAKALALGLAAVPMLVAACGGSSQSSGNSNFVSAANGACTTQASTVGSVDEKVGEQYKPFTAPWAAGSAAGRAVAARQAVAALQGLKPPSGQSAAFKSYVNDTQQLASLLDQEKAAATKGDAPTFKAVDQKVTALEKNAQTLAQKMGLSACADRGLSSSSVAQISHVISSTAVTNSPSQCTQNFTQAFIKQNWGSMAGCIKNGKQPVGANNPKSVDVSNVQGAGDFATADVVFHYASGKKQNLSVAILNQNGSWRLLGSQTR